ncbi:MAG: trypsin-like peptidase domain-containing protein, partial [Oscillospiraceae bacterium]|nr:trypsin-like peptidase domain-containing protein [Oscillospiraceae bacterium]
MMNQFNNSNRYNYNTYQYSSVQQMPFPRPKPTIVDKRGKLRTVVALCCAVLVFGGAVGYGMSQAFLEVAFIAGEAGMPIPGFEPPSPYIPDNDIDRSAWQGISSINGAEQSAPVAEPPSRPDNAMELDAATLFEMRSDTVVGVKLVRPSFGGGTATTDIIGSGVIISADGFIITNAHVIEGSSEVIVVVDDYDGSGKSREFPATVFGYDSPTDLAVLKIERDESFRYSPIGSSRELRVGQTVVAIGNPVGLHKTMSKGIVSGLDRELSDSNPFMLPSIQTDAAVNPGNSGGPLFNMYGEVVGIVNIKLVAGFGGPSLDNLGFAISIDEAMPIIDDLAMFGHVASRAMLGITAVQINESNHAMYGTDITAGLYVTTVTPDTPAAKAGLSHGDIITHIEG